MKPIVLLANYRTGSTAYSAILANQHNFVNFSEPHYKPGRIDQLSTMLVNSKTNFVLKIMPDQINTYPIYQKILEQDRYVIKLTRDNKVEQIVSYYIAKITDKWSTTNPNIHGQVYKISVIKSKLIQAIEYILEVDRLLDMQGIKFDEEITYESISDALTVTAVDNIPKKLVAPSNYEELKQYTAQLINE